MPSDHEKADSVYDVLYADIRRLSSLLSQFSDDGVVTEITRAAEDSSTTDIGLSLRIIKGTSANTGKQGSTRKIDPQWLLPLLFLDRAKNIINREITTAPIGGLALVTGKLVVTDLSILQEMWKSPAMKKHLIASMTQSEETPSSGKRHDRRANRNVKSKADTTQQEAVLDMLPHMPHTPQMNIVTDDFAVWSAINPEFLVGNVSDLVLKHGAKVAGRWNMVGILDAKPWEEREDGDYDEILSFMEQLRLGMTTDNIWKLATELARPTREAFGRPFLSYGMTPLIVFREIDQGLPFDGEVYAAAASERTAEE